MQIDKLRRSDVTVFTVGVGREVVYDITRVIDRKKGQELSILMREKCLVAPNILSFCVFCIAKNSHGNLEIAKELHTMMYGMTTSV